ncbi:MAG: sensor histidine kinase, partial [bacterium]
MNDTSRSPEMVFTDADLRELLWLGDQIPGGFFIYRANGKQELVYANRATLRIFGCEDEDEFRALTGGTFRGMVHPEDVNDVMTSIDRQIADDVVGQLDYVEYRIVRKDGEVRWVDDYGHFAQMPGYGDVYYVFIIDVTDKRRIQAEKQRAELELAHEKQANDLKDSFLFNVSHDIRTPINAVLGFSELARRHMDDPARLADYLDKTTASGRQMLSLIDDMLELNILRDGRIALNEVPTDLRVELGMSAEMFRLSASPKDVTIVTRLDLPEGEVLTDRNRFR